MTYGKLKVLLKGLLVGDTMVPNDNETLLALLEYSFTLISDKAEALHLLTLNETEDISRFATGEYLMRTPKLPKNDEDELDIDHELCYVVARYMASMISKEKIALHEQKANEGILTYNGKVYQILETLTLKKKEQENGLQQ